MFLSHRVFTGVVAVLCLGTADVPRAQPYRWRRLPVGEGVTALAIPTEGALAIVAADGVGYVVRRGDRADRIPMDRVTGVSSATYVPDVVVAVGRAKEDGNLRFSVDGGRSWRPSPKVPAMEDGSIALSSDGKIWVWSGARGAIRSDDDGFTWTPCEDVPVGGRVVADPTSFRRFYALADGRLYASDDGAKGFDERGIALPGLPGDDAPQAVVPTPGRAGDLWLLTRSALYRQLPGKAFVRVPGVADPRALGFGRSPHSAYPGNLNPTLFVAGTVEGKSGVFRSNTEGGGWTALEDAPPLSSLTTIVGDPKRYGRVFAVSSVGGLFVGDAKP